MNKKETRTRNWTIVVYPESLPDNWVDLIDELHIEWICSPLHDKDINATGEVKKPHYHVLLMFGGVKSYDQVVEVIQPLNCPIPQRCHNAKSMVRYMVHMDNPDKAKYNLSDIRSFGGVDIFEMLRPSSSERYDIVRDMINFIKDNGISEYQDLVDYALSEQFDDWWPLLCDSCSFVIQQYIKSVRHRQRAGE